MVAETGPAELRRAFKFFDRSGDGKIDQVEFNRSLERYCGLKFEKPVRDQLFAKFSTRNSRRGRPAVEDDRFQRGDSSNGPLVYINYQSFCELLMESSSSSGTGLNLKTRSGRSGGS